jgi:hypothetical protein
MAESTSPATALAVLSKPIGIGKFKIPLGLLVLIGAGVLALISLNQKKGKASGETANALVGQYDPAQLTAGGSGQRDNGIPTPTTTLPILPVPLIPSPAPSTNVTNGATFANTSGYIKEQFGLDITAPVAGMPYPTYPVQTTLPTSPSPSPFTGIGEVLFKPVIGSGSYITLPLSGLPSNAIKVGYRDGVAIYSPPGPGVEQFPY